MNRNLIKLQFFIADWITAYGYTTTFAVQGAITVCVAVPTFILIQHFGPRMRLKSGVPAWVNPEYDVL